MSGRRVAPPSARTARVRTRSRGARRADTSALAAWGAAAPGHRQTVSLVTLSAVLLVSTALVSGGTSQPELTADHRSAPQTEAKAGAPGTPGVVLSRPTDRSGGTRTAVATDPAKKTATPAQDPAKGSAVAGPAGDSDEQARLTSQSSNGNAAGAGPGAGTTAGSSAGTGPVAGQQLPGRTTLAPETGGHGTAPGDGGTEPPAPGTPAQPGPSAPAVPSTPPPVVPPATQPPAPKPPAPQPGTPAPKPPQNTGCIVDVLGIKICLPVLGG
ncbi:hypothetical protein [Arthrobacter sp. RCC_34]|uniref:hypothetical protein n=1 Tax=Arthrobacter sp. RCC_34 TaxID=3239230 RepID=UPI0035259799